MIFQTNRETKNELNEISSNMKKLIDKIPPGHELYVYREHLI